MEQKEEMMIQVTLKANERIHEFFKDRKEEPVIRIYLSQGG
jgi:Fe-S cluster assembly iron-binding protein IscA